MASIAIWKRTKIPTECTTERQSVVVRSPGAARRPDNPYESEFSRRVEREASLGERANTAALLAGRAIFGGFFLMNAFNHFKKADMMAGYSASKGVPAPKLAVLGSGALIGLGGLSLLFGVKPKVGAGMIAAFLLGVTPKMHDFWNETDPKEKMNNQVNFMKNAALLGGASLVAAVPEPWPVSLGNR